MFKVFTIYGCGDQLGQVTLTIYTNYGSLMKFGFDGQAVSERNNGHVHVYSPGQGQTTLCGQINLKKHKASVNLVICCKFQDHRPLGPGEDF